jgi:plasmid stabilization system protein ParE
VKLVFAPQALDDIEVASRWWHSNRPAAPELLDRELLAVLALLQSAPLSGALLRSERLPGVRRVPLPRARYLLYYRSIEEADTVRVLRLWHASRGTTPSL